MILNKMLTQNPAAYKKTKKKEQKRKKYIMTEWDLFQECKDVYMLGK